MSVLGRGIQALGKRAKQAVGLSAAVIVLLALVYRVVFAFAPPWLDLIAVIAAGLAVLVLWLLGRGSTFDYSVPIKRPGSERGGDHEA
jgi:hypothetical protein